MPNVLVFKEVDWLTGESLETADFRRCDVVECGWSFLDEPDVLAVSEWRRFYQLPCGTVVCENCAAEMD